MKIRPRRLLASLVGIYVSVCAGLYLIQARLLYYPTRIAPAEAAAIARPGGFAALDGPDGTLLAWQRISPSGACPVHFLVAHGNGGMALDRGYLIEGLIATPGYADACVTVIEYPGYGAATGEPGIAAMTARALAVYDRLASTSSRIVLIGESLGSGIIAAVAAARPAAGILLITPYDDLASVAQEHYPWLPVRWLLRENLRPIDTLPAYQGPITLIIAGADRIIPPAHAERLAQALPQEQVYVVQGADHMDTYDEAQRWWPAALSRLAPAP